MIGLADQSVAAGRNQSARFLRQAYVAHATVSTAKGRQHESLPQQSSMVPGTRSAFLADTLRVGPDQPSCSVGIRQLNL